VNSLATTSPPPRYEGISQIAQIIRSTDKRSSCSFESGARKKYNDKFFNIVELGVWLNGKILQEMWKRKYEKKCI
jgi:hypothetical protein